MTGRLHVGGTGNDIYVVDNAADVVTEYADEGIDTVDATIGYTLGEHFENLVLIDAGGLNGTGNDPDNVIWGNDYDNLLNGGGGVDTIKGGGGADIIDGGTDANTMLGGQGYDIFIVDNAGDVVTEAIGEGFDQVQTSVSYSLTAGSEVEVLYADPATTTAAINLTGNEFDDIVVGNDGINVLVGGLGVDTFAATAAPTGSCGRPSMRSACPARTSSPTTAPRRETCSTSPTSIRTRRSPATRTSPSSALRRSRRRARSTGSPTAPTPSSSSTPTPIWRRTA